jgi:hypothetical protein
MHSLMQTNAGTTGLVNAAIVVLIIIFLTLPLVFILADFLRGKRNRAEGSASASATLSLEGQAQAPPTVQVLPVYTPAYAPSVQMPAPQAQAQAPAAQAAAPPPPIIAVPNDGLGVRRVATGHVAHDFTREAVPPEIGYLPPGRRIDGPVAYAGHLQVGPGCTVVGDIDVTGSLAIGDGSFVGHDVSATGNVYLGRSTQVTGAVKAGGRVFMVAWSRAAVVRSEGPVELEEGAQVTETIEAPDVEHVDRVHDPLVRARQGVHVAVVPTA